MHGNLGAAHEVDYMLRNIGDGAVGLTHATQTFVPGNLRHGPVIGGGVEIDLQKGVALRI